MEQPRTLIFVAALTLVAVTLGLPGATGQQSASSDRADTSKSDHKSGDTGKTTPAASPVPSSDEPLKALDALAESFDTSVTLAALQQRMTRELVMAGKLPPPDDRLDDAKRLLRVFLQIAAPKDRHALARLDVAAAGNLTAADESAFSTTIAKYFAHPVNPAKLQIAVLEEVARRQATGVRFLIATLPDPIGSYTGWQFDPMVSAIAEAITASDFVYDHANLAGADPASAATAAARRQLHESESGALVFRKHREERKPGEADKPRELLVLLIVNENPAKGAHVQALTDALRLVTLWSDQMSPAPSDRENVISILGPTFSGSSESIVRAIERAHRLQMLDRVAAIRVITGSATDSSNTGVFDRALRAELPNRQPAITFKATVQPDSVVLSALVRHMGSLGWTDRMAVLYEENTQYGRSLEDTGKYGLDSSRVILLPFSMNVSHLRESAPEEKLGVAQALGLSSHFGSLSMDALPAPVDQIPQMTPSKTASYVELGLSTLLQRMRTERVGRVVLMATDPRDKLFLASQVMRAVPNVSLVTLESDSIYYHPDYAYYMQGTLVASTYALYSGSQRWSYGFSGGDERHVFANGSAEGTYNATLLLLDYDDAGRPVAADAPPLIDYSMPGDSCAKGCEPPVWISVVGTRGAWPLQPTPGSAGDYVLRLAPLDARGSSPIALETFPSSSFIALLVVVTALLVLVGIDITVQRGRWATTLFGRGWASTSDDAMRRYAYVGAAVTSLVAVEVVLVAIWTMHIRLGPAGSPDSVAAAGVGWVVAIAGLLPLAVVELQLVGRIARDDRARLTRVFDLRHLDTWLRLMGAGVCVWAAVSLEQYIESIWITAGHEATAASFVARATDFSNGVSPVVPIVFLFAAFVLWGVAELVRLRGAGAALLEPTVHPVMRQALNGRLERVTKAWAKLGPSILAVPPSLVWIVILAVASTCLGLFDPFVRPLMTIEGSFFGRFAASAILLLQAMIGLALLQFVCLWSVLKALLERLVHDGSPNAYLTVPRGIFPSGLFPRMPTIDDLEPLVEYREACLTKNRQSGVGDLRRVIGDELQKDGRGRWSCSPTWRALLTAATSSRPAAGRLRPIDCETARLREMCVTLVVRDAVARLWHNLVFVVGAMLCVFCSYTLFPFQIQKALEVVGWIYVAVTFGAVVRVLLQMRSNEFLRRVAALDPAKDPGWDSAFILRLAIFVLVPLVTLFAAQFPDIGGLLMRFVDPVRKILP